MKMPGFTAEVSLHKTSAHYRVSGPRGAMSGRAEVFPQQTTSMRLPESLLRLVGDCVVRAPRRDPSCIPDYRQCESTCKGDCEIDIPGDPPFLDEGCVAVCRTTKCEHLCPALPTGDCLCWEWKPVRFLQWAE